MASKFLAQAVSLAEPLIASRGAELVDAEYKKEGTDYILRFYVDLLEGSITLDECAEISNLISDALDGGGLGEGAFILEVSSPGVERVLNKPSDYVRFTGRKVDVSLFSGEKTGARKFTAVLEGYDPGCGGLTLSLPTGSVTVTQGEIAKLNLHFDF